MHTYVNLVNVEKHKEAALAACKENWGQESDEDLELLFDGKAFTGEVQEVSFRDGFLEYSVCWSFKGDTIVTTWDNIEIDLDLASEIVNHFMKKVGKLKTVLEATK